MLALQLVSKTAPSKYNMVTVSIFHFAFPFTLLAIYNYSYSTPQLMCGKHTCNHCCSSNLQLQLSTLNDCVVQFLCVGEPMSSF